MKKKKVVIIIVVAVLVVLAAGLAVYFGIFYNRTDEEEIVDEIVETTTEEEIIPVNPLTGEDGFDADALNSRYLCVSVENSQAARPQYNMESADMIFEVQVEGGITRMVWLYADMNSIPDELGPVRSARPVTVAISEWFDSIFVHYGGSHTSGDYKGAYEIISTDHIDDIDGMTMSCFRRTSDKVSPHNAVVVKDELLKQIKKQGYSTTKSENVTTFDFYDKLTPVSETPCTSTTVTFSSTSEVHKLNYDSDKGLYINSNDYGKEIDFTNLIVLYDSTSYMKTSEYEYCLYSLEGGSGKLMSGGAAKDINWSIEDGVLVLEDENGEPIKLNKGKSWVALISSSKGGNITIS